VQAGAIRGWDHGLSFWRRFCGAEKKSANTNDRIVGEMGSRHREESLTVAQLAFSLSATPPVSATGTFSSPAQVFDQVLRCEAFPRACLHNFSQVLPGTSGVELVS
jgi:hypothetical protein